MERQKEDKYRGEDLSDFDLLYVMARRAANEARDVVKLLEDYCEQLKVSDTTTPISLRMLEMVTIYRHLVRVRVDSGMVGVERY